jgi:hypothetical protein
MMVMTSVLSSERRARSRAQSFATIAHEPEGAARADPRRKVSGLAVELERLAADQRVIEGDFA